MNFDKISNDIESLLTENEREELSNAFLIAGTDEDYHIVKYAEKLDLPTATLRSWNLWMNGGMEA